MQTQYEVGRSSGSFLVQKSVFLLSPSVGKAMAETLINQSLEQLGIKGTDILQSDIPALSTRLEVALRPFVGDEKAQRLASALRVLVGGIASTSSGA
jgi:hypothetical protein